MSRAAEREVWLASRPEPILDPNLPVIDAHHHLWDRGGQTYLAAAFLADAAGHRLAGSVYVECLNAYRAQGPEALRVVGETEFALAQREAAGGRAVAAIVGAADLMLGDAVAAVLEAQVEAGAGRFRGVRVSTAFEPTGAIHSLYATRAGMMGESAFRAGFARLAPLGLSFDAWCYFSQLHELAALADAFPDTTIVMNHCGGPLGLGAYAARRDDVRRVWLAGIAEVARRPNVVAKLGGLGMRIAGFDFARRPAPPSSQDLAEAWRPFVQPLIDAFGPDRCLFESNFPVDRVSCSFATLWNAFKRLAGPSADEKRALLHDVAGRIYRL